MRRTHRLPARLISWMSLCVCIALILSSLSLIIPVSGKSGVPQSSGINNRNVKKVAPKAPQPGAPSVTLPNLDNARRSRNVEPKAARQVESTVRSRRKPVESRQGRKVGDPLPPKQKASTDTIGDGSERVGIASAEKRGNVGTARFNQARTTRSLPTGEHSSASSARLLKLVESKHSLSNHSTFDFLHHPALHSDSNGTSTGEVHRVYDSISIASQENADSEGFDLFVAPMPQSGSTKIVFATNRDGSMQIYVMNGDGSAVTRLTYSGANDDYPRWSPNGTKILFQSDRDHPDTGYMDIYVMNSDGSGVTRLTTDPNDDSMASWSPDGSQIVFQSMRNGVNYQVYSMNADGSNQVCLTNTSSSDGEPSWSANGAKIAFASDRDHAGYDCVYVMNTNGSGQQRLTFSASTVDDTQPAWSRDSSRIAFVSTRDSTTETWQETDDNGNYITKSRVHINKEIYLMNSDGSGQTRLTNDLGNDDAPSWSPDGTKIVWRTDRDRDCCDPSAQVWTMNADGSNQVDVSNNGNGDYVASWTSGSSNQLPIANANGTYSGILSQNVPFRSTGSYDPDGSIVSYSWTFGDGGTASSAAPTHAYTTVGTYTVTLTVTDNLGAQGSASTTVTISASSSDQYSVNFLQAGLGRSLIGNEGPYWTDITRAAYLQGQPSMLMAMSEFGMTVFDSAEYVGRNRSDHDYVYDLYETFLMRYPDQDGWDFWTYQASPLHMGRIQVRNAFEASGEFHNIVAALQTSGNPSSAAASLATAQVDPFNQSGNQVQARDCEWGLSLVSLPGRAGLDLGLNVSYSSLVWTHSGPYVYFDQDKESLGPGFTIGFPTVQFRKFDAQTARNVYVFSAGGHHVELRQVGTSNYYEAADSSYLQLIDNGGSLLLRTTGGTQMSFTGYANNWGVTAIEDRNGNFISVQNDWRGDIQNITDTLGRTIFFNYDGNANLISITQSWAGQSQPHTWATFGWTTVPMAANFSSEVVGTFNGENMPVLTQIALDDGSRYNFEYNGTMQASVIRRYTFDPSINDYGQRTYTAYDYQGTDDCPRIYRARVWAQSWNSSNGVPSEVVTQFVDPGDGSRETIAPDQTTVYKEFYGSNWQHGLVTSTQILAGSTVQKTTTTSYTQDDTSVNYQTNPRVTASDITDGTNHRHTTIGYQTFTLPTTDASCSLPNEGYEYDADQTTVLRRTHTDYNLDTTNYLSRRIIGLLQAKLVYKGMSALMTKTTYLYDWNGDYLQGLSSAPTQHDSGYSTDFALGRGNLVDVQRWDVNYPTDSTRTTENKIGYDIDGSVIFTLDALTHRNSISYSDSFAGTYSGANTFAYPTTLKDGDDNQTLVQYNYSFGAKTQVQGPPPQNQPNGIVQNLSYDDAARLLQTTTANNGAYTRYYYGPYYVQSWSSVNNLADDAYSVQTFDGLGRPLGAAANHPGSTGGYKAQMTKYDSMGRAVATSNPTEIDGSWNPTGDDPAYLYTQQSYDWKGRPRVTTHPDETYKEAAYDGCGCAGGEVVTLSDEMGRPQKIYSDALGRQWKTEVLNLDGSVYSTAETTLNARDQAMLVRQFSGTDQSGIYQDTTMSYDGYGRLQYKHAPEQSGGTTYAYYNDDTVSTVTDARGATVSHSYNGRHLVTGISYNAPYGILVPGTASFDYDAAGNRLSMIDGLGRVDYQYDQLSRMQSESRRLNGLPNAPVPNNAYTISYSYNFAGELTSITDPFNQQTTYNRDSSGRLTNLSVPGYNGIPDTMSSVQYRAWGKPKQLSLGWNGSAGTVNYDYDSRMEVSRFQATGAIGASLGAQYQRNADGQVSFAQDLQDNEFDRAYFYDDQMGRVIQGLSGAEARGSSPADGPYKQNYGFDAFSNMTTRSGRHWTHNTGGQNFTYVNNRNTTNSQWQYDADGRPTQAATQTFRYDAAGRQIDTIGTPADLYDGDGRRVKDSSSSGGGYKIVSSVLGGQPLTYVMSNGAYGSGWIYADGNPIGRTSLVSPNWWEIHSPVNSDMIRISQGHAERDSEFSPIGDNVGTENPYLNGGGDGSMGYPSGGGDASNMKCAIDGNEADCSSVFKFALRRNWAFLITRIIEQRFSSVVEQTSSQLVSGGSHAGNTILGEANTTDQTKVSHVEVIGEPDRFDTTTVGAFEETVGLRITESELVQNPAQVARPIGGLDKLQAEFEKALKFGDCKEAMSKVLARIGSDTNFAPSTTDIMELFNALKNQTGGGGIFVDVPYGRSADVLPGGTPIGERGGGGAGESNFFYTDPANWRTRQRWSVVFLKTEFANTSQLNIDRLPYEYVVTLIHEITHNAPNDSSGDGETYTHGKMNQAAFELDGSTSFDQYVKKHCIPKKYW